MNDRQIIQEFLVESRENLDQLDQDLVFLEKDPRNRERLTSIFRTIHTIKGTCGFFGFDRLEAVTHAGESLLSRLRDGHLLFTPEIATGLLSLVDTVRRILKSIEGAGQEGDEDHTQLVATLSRLKGGSLILPPEKPKSSGSTSAACPPSSDLSGEKQQASSRPALPAQANEGNTQERHAAETAAEPAPGSAAEAHIRVDVGLLDKLMNLVGELVLARNQIVQYSGQREDSALSGMAQRLDQIATELQESVMKTRMQPIGNLWNKFPRLVRDLALACGKDVRLILDGADTELDKSILEAIKDPLTHLLRNAVDHGIETPEARRARGKRAEGHLVLRAFHEGGQVNIDVSDDGAGVNLERIKRKAIETALLSHEDAGRLTDRQALDLIFLPGLSTAEKVTSVSGRGVGMDVVKTNIEKIGGTLEIQSRPGQGTSVKIKIPLTLAIVPALVVSCGGERFAIPQANLLELVRLSSEKERCGVELIHGAPVYRLRGNLLPLIDLAGELRLPRTSQAVVNIVVLQADECRFGLMVDKVNDTQEIVVKPLGKLIKSVSLYAGATILGDGHVVLILDVVNIAQRARVMSEVRSRMPLESTVKSHTAQDDKQALLLCELRGNRRVALPLSRLARLEKIAASAVERTGDQEVMQYRGGILPLVRLSKALPGSQEGLSAGNDLLQVVVYGDQNDSVGLVVERIVDIVQTGADVHFGAANASRLNSAVIAGRVTELVEISSLIGLRHAAADRRPCLAGAGG